MPSTTFFIIGTLLLSLNFVRFWGFAISDWFYVGSLVLAIFETITIQRKHLVCWWRNRFLWMAGLILFGAIISTYNAKSWRIAFIEIGQQIFVITLFISLIWIMVRRGKTKEIVFAFIFSGVFTAGIAVVDYLTGKSYGPLLSGTLDINYAGRYAGTLGHPNKLGFFLVLTTLLSLGYLFSIRKSRVNIALSISFWVAIIGVQIFGIFLTNSMTAYLGLLTGLFAFLFSAKFIKTFIMKVSFKKLITYFLIFFVICFLAIILFSFSNNEFLSAFTGNIVNAWDRVTTNTAESRMVVFKLAWESITLNPLVGVGYDMISTAGTGQVQSLLGFGVHNALLQIWYIGGLIAFIGSLSLYISIGWSALSTLMRKTPNLPILYSLAVSTLALLLMDQFQDSIYQREKWLVIGLMASLVWERARKVTAENISEIRK